MRAFLIVGLLFGHLGWAQSTPLQSSQQAIEAQSAVYLRTLPPEKLKKYQETRDGWSTQPPQADEQGRITSLCRQALTTLGYDNLGPGGMDNPTHKAILKFQKAKGIQPSGELNAITFYAISTALDDDSGPGFRALLRSRSLPKWATSVCFEDTKGSATESGYWFVFGAKGFAGIRATSYLQGKPQADINFERIKSVSDTGAFRSTPWKEKGGDWIYMELNIDWPTHTFIRELKSTNTNETVARLTGHCRSIDGLPAE